MVEQSHPILKAPGINPGIGKIVYRTSLLLRIGWRTLPEKAKNVEKTKRQKMRPGTAPLKLVN